MSRHTLKTIKFYQEALEKLKNPKYNEVKIWLHDYDEKCYKTDPDYTLNGLHWGYPDAVASAVTNKFLDDNTLAFEYAGFKNKDNKNPKLYSENSRFILVPYKKVRKIIELGIAQKLEKAKKDHKASLKSSKKWKEETDALPFGKAALRIEFTDSAFTVKALKPTRFAIHGFGSFLEDAKKGEISVCPEAMKALDKIPYRSGLMGLEVGLGSCEMVSYASKAYVLTGIPVDAVSVDKKGWLMLKKIITVE